MTEILRLKLPCDAGRAVDALAALMPDAGTCEPRLRYGRSGYLILEVEDPPLIPVNAGE